MGPTFLVLGFLKSWVKLPLTAELEAYAPEKVGREAQKFSVVALPPSHQWNTGRRQKGYGRDKESPAY